MKLLRVLAITACGFILCFVLTAVIFQTVLDIREVGDTTWPLEVAFWGGGITLFLASIWVFGDLPRQPHAAAIALFALLLVGLVVWLPLGDFIAEIRHATTRQEIETMAQYGDVPAILAFFSDPDDSVRLATQDGLRAYVATHSDLAPFNQALLPKLKDPDERVRGEIALALGVQGNTAAVPGLVEALNAEKIPAVTIAILGALATIGDAAAPGLRAYLKTLIAGRGDSSLDHLAVVTVKALGDLRDKDAVLLLTQLLSDQYSCVSAVEALKKIGDAAAIPALTKLHDEISREGYCWGLSKETVADVITTLRENSAPQGPAVEAKEP